MIYDINFYFGNNLRKFREEKNLSQTQFAEECKISRAYYGRIERGEHSATIELCQKISDFLGIHISDLFTDLPM
jgi:transcriptional regulator with XRE-family HTH domain